MAFLNGTEAAAERRAADDTESGQTGPKPGVQSGPEDITITIRGSTAARMLGRGDAEERILAELRELRQRLDGMEAGAALHAAEDGALRQTVEALHGTVAQLGGRVADQAAELGRLRSALDSQARSVVHVPGQVERVQALVNALQIEVHPLACELEELRKRLAVVEQRMSAPRRPILGGRRRQANSASANGEASADGSSLRQRLNGLWFW